jgi:outer membrane protein assembly factor BamE (lipoprotein component of BamABCDE complex)
MRRLFAAAGLAVGLAASGCAPTYTTHGFTPAAEELDQITAGLDTRESVFRRLGNPSMAGTFEGDEWFYVASRIERYAFYEPKVVDRTVVVIAFDDAGVVESVERYGLEEGRVVDLVTRTTPTYGRELTVLQQLFGNVGRVDPGRLLNE